MTEHPTAGEVISHYRLVEPVGAGGMGVVWRAEDLTLGRPVALKFISPTLETTPGATARLQREARAAAALNHPGICTIYEVGEYRGLPFIAMELLEGRSLDAHLNGRPLETRRLIDIAVQVTHSLAAAHTGGVVHRDIKPANIFITAGGAAKLLDFGVAHLLPEPGDAESPTMTMHRLTGIGSSVGTPAYMSPEQARGESVDARSDVFSLGAVLYEMATGKSPFARPTAATTFEAILNQPPPPIDSIAPGVPADLARVIARALEKDPSLRFQSAADLLSDLKRLRRDLDIRARPDRAGPPSDTGGPALKHGRRVGPALGLGLLLFLVIGAAAIWNWRAAGSPPATASHVTSILVLPLDISATNPRLDDFADGLTEALINRLSSIVSLRVLARNTSFRFKGTSTDPLEAGRQLAVGAVVTGRVEEQDDTLRVGVELVDVSTGSQLWGSHYIRKGSAMLDIEQDISRAIAESLRARLSENETTNLSGRPTDSLEAYRLYLTGRRRWNQRTAQDLQSAIEYFNRAIDADAEFALAYSGIAESYVLLPAPGISAVAPRDAMPKARAAALKALELDPRIPEAHTALGYVLLHYDLDWEGAGRQFDLARANRPSDASFWRAAYLAATGKADEAIAEAERAQVLDPLSGIVTAGVAWMHHLAGGFEQERVHALKALELNPQLAMAHMRLGWALTGLGRHTEAIDAHRAAVTHSGGSADMLAFLSHALARAGRPAEARAILDQLRGQAGRYVSALSMAFAYTALDDRPQALSALEAAYDERAWGLALVVVEPAFDSLRGEPRFAALVRRLNIPR